ncbi:MAG: ABC transporter permease [Huintestinicola sp.]
MKSLVFASRNIKEILRDPLSWVFCLGFPLVMMFIMSIVNSSITEEAGLTIFRIENLAPGIAIFALTFIMLFATLLVAGDRSEAFLLRVYTSPMKPSDYIAGYLFPLIILSAGQSLITGVVAVIWASAQGTPISIVNMLASIILTLPSAIMFVSFGLLFGTLFNKNAAPGLCSIIISFSGMLGGIYMDVESIGGKFYDVCRFLPFIHSVNSARYAYSGQFTDSLCETGIISVWAVVILIISIVVFRKKMKF